MRNNRNAALLRAFPSLVKHCTVDEFHFKDRYLAILLRNLRERCFTVVLAAFQMLLGN